MNKLYIPIIFAAATEKRQSYTELCAHATKIFVEKADINTEIIDAQKEIQFCHANREIDTPEARVLREKLNRADGFIIVSPEYNHGYPGDLKNLLDSFLDEYNRKPVGIIGVSSGGIGGARVIEQLRLVAIALAMIPISGAILFSQATKLFNDDKTFNAEKEYEPRFKKFLDELIWYAEALKVAREK
ncbi:MAG: NAD(P)H-dependent oxidoreductase [Patescibacteria group bacterium]|jgi:NAD(P)H-dependent FMN reductase